METINCSSNSNSSNNNNKTNHGWNRIIVKLTPLSLVAWLVLVALITIQLSSTTKLSSSSSSSSSSCEHKQQQQQRYDEIQATNETSSTSTTAGNNDYPSATTFDSKQQQQHDEQHSYAWIGNTWIPPTNVPYYKPRDYINYFSKYNTLFIGDSTLRRSYCTLYALMNATTNAYDISVEELDHTNVIDVNKYKTTEYCTKPNYFDPQTARGKLWTNTTFFCRGVGIGASNHNDNNDNQDNNNTIIGRFDFASAACYKDLYNFVDVDLMLGQSTSKDYTLIVIGMGIWESTQGTTCSWYGNNNNNENNNNDNGDQPTQTQKPPPKRKKNDGGPLGRLKRTVEWLTMLPSSNRRVVWRTTGFHVDGIGDKFNYPLNDRTKELFRELSHKDQQRQIDNYKRQQQQSSSNRPPMIIQPLNWTIVDWGSVISKRSYGNTRIAGDIGAHYGLVGRLLFNQMLLHELLVLEQKERNDGGRG